MLGAAAIAILGSITLLAAVPINPVSVEYGAGAGGAARTTARVVSAIATYTRWPAGQRNLRLCVVGPAEHAGSFDTIGPIGGKETTTVRVAPENAARSGCNILYLGRMGAEALRAQTVWSREQQILTIAEADPACRSGAMVCLQYLEDGLNFELNLDAISRSGLRVDPRVMRIGRGGVS